MSKKTGFPWRKLPRDIVNNSALRFIAGKVAPELRHAVYSVYFFLYCEADDEGVVYIEDDELFACECMLETEDFNTIYNLFIQKKLLEPIDSEEPPIYKIADWLMPMPNGGGVSSNAERQARYRERKRAKEQAARLAGQQDAKVPESTPEEQKNKNTPEAKNLDKEIELLKQQHLELEEKIAQLKIQNKNSEPATEKENQLTDDTAPEVLQSDDVPPAEKTESVTERNENVTDRNAPVTPRNETVTECNAPVTERNESVTPRYAEDRREKSEEEIELERESERIYREIEKIAESALEREKSEEEIELEKELEKINRALEEIAEAKIADVEDKEPQESPICTPRESNYVVSGKGSEGRVKEDDREENEGKQPAKRADFKVKLYQAFLKVHPDGKELLFKNPKTTDFGMKMLKTFEKMPESGALLFDTLALSLGFLSFYLLKLVDEDNSENLIAHQFASAFNSFVKNDERYKNMACTPRNLCRSTVFHDVFMKVQSILHTKPREGDAWALCHDEAMSILKAVEAADS